METLIQDLRYAIRQLRRSPGFAAVAIATLALGIGANTVIFSVVNGVLLSPLPFAEPDKLVTLHENKPNFEGGSLSYPNFRDWQKNNRTFSSMAVARSYSFSMTGTREPEQLNGEFVSAEFFPTLGVNLVLGRTFAKGEDEVGAAPVAMISAGLWRRNIAQIEQRLARCGADPPGFHRSTSHAAHPSASGIESIADPACSFLLTGRTTTTEGGTSCALRSRTSVVPFARPFPP